jgi:hypothetical protein
MKLWHQEVWRSFWSLRMFSPLYSLYWTIFFCLMSIKSLTILWISNLCIFFWSSVVFDSLAFKKQNYGKHILDPCCHLTTEIGSSSFSTSHKISVLIMGMYCTVLLVLIAKENMLAINRDKCLHLELCLYVNVLHNFWIWQCKSVSRKHLKRFKTNN